MSLVTSHFCALNGMRHGTVGTLESIHYECGITLEWDMKSVMRCLLKQNVLHTFTNDILDLDEDFVCGLLGQGDFCTFD